MSAGVAARRPGLWLASGGWLLPLAIVPTLLAYPGTWGAMADVWLRSDTYAHGLVVLPLAGWLAWRLRHRVASLPLRPAPMAGLGWVLVCALIWVIGRIGSIDELEGLATVAAVPGVAIAFAGLPRARALAFPFTFLLLAVPVGGFLVEPMMEQTASVTVWALRATGIPVYRDGMTFVLPTGAWSVVEACSGHRYLIASVVLGALYAHLCFESPHRQASVLAASIIVPVIANWVRAYGIVITGHLTDMRVAVGADHLLYGWLFFGLVWYGLLRATGRWRERDPGDAPSVPTASLHGVTPPQPIGVLGLLACTVVMFAGSALAATLQSRPTADASPVPDVPGFEVVPSPPARIAHYPTSRASLHLSRMEGDRSVHAFVARFERQHDRAEMLAHTNGWLAPDAVGWQILAETPYPLETSSGRLPAIRADIAAPDGSRWIGVRWYTIGGVEHGPGIGARFALVRQLLAEGSDRSAVAVVWLHSSGDPSGDAAKLASAAGAVAPVARLTSRVASTAGRAVPNGG
jgi:exosortase A